MLRHDGLNQEMEGIWIATRNSDYTVFFILVSADSRIGNCCRWVSAVYETRQSTIADFAPGAPWRATVNNSPTVCICCVKVLKPEVHHLLQCCQRRTELQPQKTCTENFVKFGHVCFEICERTDRQTHTHRRRSQYFAWFLHYSFLFGFVRQIKLATR